MCIIFTSHLISSMSAGVTWAPAQMHPLRWKKRCFFSPFIKHGILVFVCSQGNQSVPWREQMMYHLFPPSFDILFLYFFFRSLSLEGCDEGVVSPPTRKLRKCEHCVRAREEYKISLWWRRRVSISLIYIQTSCCLVKTGWWGHAGSITPTYQQHLRKLVSTLLEMCFIHAKLSRRCSLGYSSCLPLKEIVCTFPFLTPALRD